MKSNSMPLNNDGDTILLVQGKTVRQTVSYNKKQAGGGEGGEVRYIPHRLPPRRPQIPDFPPGQTVEAHGIVTFYEGPDVKKRIRKLQEKHFLTTTN